MKKINILLMGIGVILVGCSGSSTSDKNEQLYMDNSTLSKVKNMFRSKKNTTTKEVNIATLIASTFGNLDVPLQRVTAYGSAVSKEDKYIHTQIDMAIDPKLFKKDLPEFKQAIINQESAIKAIEIKNPEIYARGIKALDAARNGNNDNYLWWVRLSNLVADSVIGEANSGCNGWYSHMDNINGVRAEMYAIAQVTYIANAVETLIADSMIDKTFYSEDDAKKYIKNYFYSIDSDKLYSILRSAQTAYNIKDFSADFTGVKGIQFYYSGEAFACTSSGIVWNKNNTDWFGAGNLSGKKYITKVEYSDGAEMQKQYKMELNDSTSTSNNNSNDSSIKSK